MNKIGLVIFGLMIMSAPAVKAADTMTKEQKAQEKLERQKDKVEFENANIDARAAHAQEMYQKVVDHVNKHYADVQTFEGSMKDARLAYEKQMLDDRLAFFNSLKTTKGADRKAAWQKFDADEKTKHDQFDADQKSKRDAFHQKEESDHQQFQQMLKTDNDQFREQLRTKKK